MRTKWVDHTEYRWESGWGSWVPTGRVEPLNFDDYPTSPQAHSPDCRCGMCFFTHTVPNDELYSKLKYDWEYWNG